MRQQINLYTEELRPRRTLISLKQMAVLALVLMLGLGVASALQYQRLTEITQQVQKKNADVLSLTQTVERLRTKAESWVKSDALVMANERLKKQRVRYEEFVNLLGDQLPARTAGFSPQVIALARQKTSQLWLTHLHIGMGDNRFLLKGDAQDAEAVPAYLQALREEAVFAGRGFDLFDMSRSEKSGRLMFVLTAGKPLEGAMQ